MSVTDSVKKADGIENCNASMVTAANREILEGLGFDIPADVGANDLVVAVIASDEACADAALALGQDLLDHKNAASGGKTYDNIEDIDLDEDPYDLVQISLPGEYAAAEAEKALKKGLDVFMFSDNVSLEDEKRLKELAISKGVLMMGPDCGVLRRAAAITPAASASSARPAAARRKSAVWSRSWASASPPSSARADATCTRRSAAS